MTHNDLDRDTRLAQACIMDRYNPDPDIDIKEWMARTSRADDGRRPHLRGGRDD